MPISTKTTEEIDSLKEKENLKLLEAIFFVSGRFLSVQELFAVSGFHSILIYELIEQLKKKYNRGDSALEIVEKNNSWKMNVRKEYSHVINKLATGSAEFSKAEQETLAIVAFKQPIKQSVLVKIRGNKAYDHVKNFYELGLVKKKKMGRTYELSLSDEFYEYFNISKSEKIGEE